jgi:hypothetical protein
MRIQYNFKYVSAVGTHLVILGALLAAQKKNVPAVYY